MLKVINEAVDEMTIKQIKTIQEKILKLIEENPRITQKQIAEKLNLTRDGIAYHIKNLKQKNEIQRIGSTKYGYWIKK